MMQTASLRIIPHNECMERIHEVHGSRLFVHSRRLCSVGEPYVLVQGVRIVDLNVSLIEQIYSGRR
jgi:hypothetical protein